MPKEFMEDQILKLLGQGDYVPANVPELLRLLRLAPHRQQELQAELRILEQAGRIVRTKLLRPKEEPVTLNYLMRGAGDNWKIVDVYLSGTISELATQRSEFGAILKSGGAAALIESLKQQIDKLMRKP